MRQGSLTRGSIKRKEVRFVNPAPTTKEGWGNLFLNRNQESFNYKVNIFNMIGGRVRGIPETKKNMTRLKSSDQEQHKDSADQFFLHPNIWFYPQNNLSVQK